MLTIKVITDYFRDYNVDTKITSLEDIAKMIVKCKILDNRTHKYNIIGFNFEELLYNELLDIKDVFCAEFMSLIEYSFYFEQVNENFKMVEDIHQSLKFMIEIINNTREQRKNCRYKCIIDTIIKFEEDFYGNSLLNMCKLEKEQFVKNDLINHTGEVLYILEYYRLTNTKNEEKSELYWKAIMTLVTTIDKVGLQKKIKRNKNIEEKISEKTLIYNSKNKKETI